MRAQQTSRSVLATRGFVHTVIAQSGGERRAIEKVGGVVREGASGAESVVITHALHVPSRFSLQEPTHISAEHSHCLLSGEAKWPIF